MKIIAMIFAVVICGSFFIVFFATYVFLSSKAKNVTTKNEGAQDQIVTISNFSDNPSMPIEVAFFSDGTSEPRNPPDQEDTLDSRGKQGIFFLKEFVKLRKDPRLVEVPPFCEIICSRSIWKKRTEGELIWDHFNSFLDKEGLRAFDDPKFRLMFEFVNNQADIMMPIVAALEQFQPLLNRKNQLSEVEKAYWSASAPFLIAKASTKMNEVLLRGRQRQKIIKKLMELSNQCDEHSLDEIKESCQTLSKDF